MSVIVLDGETFDEFVQKLTTDIKTHLNASPQRKWIDGEEAMQILGIKSKTTLQKFRDENKIRFSQYERIILYDRDSINAFIEKHAKDVI